MRCKTCGYMMTPFEKECPRCIAHAAQPTPVHHYPVASEVEKLPTPVSPQSLCCLICDNTATEKVSALVRVGSWQENSVGASVGHGQFTGGSTLNTVKVGVTNSAGANQLASLLKPPPAPQREFPYFGCFGMIAVFFATSLFVVMMLDGKTSLLVPLVFGVIAGILLFLHSTAQPRLISEWTEQMEIWTEQMEIWDRLYYCSRCDNVYDPISRRSAPAATWASLISVTMIL